MSVLDEIEDIENRCRRKRYREKVVDNANEVQEYFDTFGDALSYAEAYDAEFNSRNPNYDPEGFAEQWYESFDGDMSGIICSLNDAD